MTIIMKTKVYISNFPKVLPWAVKTNGAWDPAYIPQTTDFK